MAKTATAPNQLRKGDKVVATTDLRAVPEGTAGKVIVVNGFTWIRYWVRFENGEVLGSISRDKLATKQDLQDKANGVVSGAVEAGDDAGADAAAGDDSSGGVTTPNGTFVPQKHIDRAKAARARLTGG
jgi:hypothetical protein